MFSREALKKICYGIPAAETFALLVCIICLHYLSILPVCTAFLHYLSVLPVCTAFQYCLSALPFCITCQYCLSALPFSALPVSIACLHCLSHYLSVLPVCTAFCITCLYYLTLLPGPYYLPCSCSSNRYFSYRNFSGSVTWKSFARRRKSSG